MEALDGDRSTMMSSFVKCWRNMGGGSLVYVPFQACLFLAITLRGLPFKQRVSRGNVRQM